MKERVGKQESIFSQEYWNLGASSEAEEEQSFL
jgi:hypothetical protein